MRPVLSYTGSSLRAETTSFVTYFSSETGGNFGELLPRPEGWSEVGLV